MEGEILVKDRAQDSSRRGCVKQLALPILTKPFLEMFFPSVPWQEKDGIKINTISGIEGLPKEISYQHAR